MSNSSTVSKILIIQTAFIGDVILATAVVEKLYAHDPTATIDMLVRKGNESLVQNHPKVHEVLIWDKKKSKYMSLVKVIRAIRSRHYDLVVNIQRFASTGLMTTLSKAKVKVGFDKNPFSMFFTHKALHTLDGKHEVERNLSLLSFMGIGGSQRPMLYPSTLDKEKIRNYITDDYVCVAPSSVWFTKQWTEEKWVALLNEWSTVQVYLLGAPDDFDFCERIKTQVTSKQIENVAGKLTLLQSAALMEQAQMNYVNDSAPMHLCSAVNAPVTAIYCSTVPRFGFGPLSEHSKVVETKIPLDCRPCGLHGFDTCPKGHFHCATTIEIQDVLSS